MQTEVMKWVSSPDLLVGHLLRHRGSYCLMKNHSYLSGTYPQVNVDDVNPVLKQVDEVGGVDSIYLPLYTDNVFQTPAYVTSTLTLSSTSTPGEYIVNNFSSPVLTSLYVDYKSDYQMSLAKIGAVYTIRIKYPIKAGDPIPSTFEINKYIAFEISSLVNSTDYERLVYFKISAASAALGEVVCTVTRVDQDGNTLAFSWADILDTTFEAVADTELYESIGYPYEHISVVKSGALKITTSATHPTMIGDWQLTYENNQYKIYGENKPALTLTSDSDFSASIPLDAVYYDLSALLVSPKMVPSAVELCFIDEGEVDIRRFNCRARRVLCTNGISWLIGTTHNCVQYILPGGDYPSESTYWTSRVRDGIFMSPPTGRLFLKISGATFKFNNVNLFCGRKIDLSSVAGTDVDDVIKNTDVCAQVIPAALIMPYYGQNSPSGWKECIGQINEERLTSGTYAPKDTFLNLTTSLSLHLSSATVSYQQDEDITTLSWKIGTTDVTSVFDNEFYEWSVQYKDQAVEMLSRPRPDNAYFEIPFGITKVKVYFPGAPALPERKQRYTKVPYGRRVTKWCPGTQFYALSSKLGDVAIETDKRMVAVMLDISMYENYRATEAGLSTNKTYPSKYPTNLLQLLVLQTKSFGKRLGITELDKGASRLYNWMDRLLGQETLPAIEFTPLSSSRTLTIRLLGDWRQKIVQVASWGWYPDYFTNIHLVKTGNIGLDSNKIGGFDFGSQQHNHVMKELLDTQLKRLDVQFKGTVLDKDSHPHWAPVCKNHTHGFVGEGSYVRPESFIVKVVEKM